MSGPVNGVMTELEAENARLRDEVARLTAYVEETTQGHIRAVVEKREAAAKVGALTRTVAALRGAIQCYADDEDEDRSRTFDAMLSLLASPDVSVPAGECKRPDPYDAPMVGERLAARPDVAAALVDDSEVAK